MANNVQDNHRLQPRIQPRIQTSVPRTDLTFAELVKREGVVSLIVAVALPLLAGILVSMYIGPSGGYKDSSNSKALSLFFGLIWITYPVMGLASWLFWVNGGIEKEPLGVGAYVLQLGCSLLWSVLFFGDRNIGGAFGACLALDFFVLMCIGGFQEVSEGATKLMFAYLLWAAIASFLTWQTWR